MSRYTIDRCRNLLRTARDRYEGMGQRVPESVNVGDWLAAEVERLQAENAELHAQAVENQRTGMVDGWVETENSVSYMKRTAPLKRGRK